MIELLSGKGQKVDGSGWTWHKSLWNLEPGITTKVHHNMLVLYLAL